VAFTGLQLPTFHRCASSGTKVQILESDESVVIPY
jgi:hypothetical protein